ncbi:MAG: hypothetical protein EOM31_02690 [Bacteroidia bacterium]|nr:hypothetical protein [Bacteroidia bacterium]
MISEALNNKLVETIAHRLPEGDNLANFLAEALTTSKEAIYRRLRGKVFFTFEEVAKIATLLNISVDRIICTQVDNRTVFDMDIMEKENLLKEHDSILNFYIEELTGISDYETSKLIIANHILPPTLYIKYSNLTRFYLYKYSYLLNNRVTTPHYADNTLSEKTTERLRILSGLLQQIKETVYLLDQTIFSTFIKDIRFFYKLNLLTLEEVRSIQQELCCLLDDLEAIASSGQYASGNSVQIYLSDIRFDTSYGYMKRNETKMSYIYMYMIGQLKTCNGSASKQQEEWFEYLKRHSTSITQSGEIQRIHYFNSQREEIGQLIP